MRDTREFEFGGYTLDPVRRLLFDATGATVPLSARAFDTLLHFLENPGGLLTKQTLLKAIWPNSIVEENNLSQSILAVRRALGESPGDHRFIVTVTGRGYRFVAPVHVREAAASDVPLMPVIQPATFATAAGVDFGAKEMSEMAADGAALKAAHAQVRGWWITRLAVPVLCLAVLLFAQLGEPTVRVLAPVSMSVAVLPFVDLTAERAQLFLAVGIASELLLRLADVPALKVISRTASFAMNARAQDLRSLGRALGANQVLEGSVRAAGERLRVSVQLIDTDSGARLWSQTYDRTLGDTHALQEELARTIAIEIARALNVESPGPSWPARPDNG